MNLTTEQLNEIKEYGALLLSPKKIARIMGFDFAEFQSLLEDKDSEVSIQYAAGRLSCEVELRRSILKLAKQGSSPAQTLAIKMRDELSLELTNDLSNE